MIEWLGVDVLPNLIYRLNDITFKSKYEINFSNSLFLHPFSPPFIRSFVSCFFPVVVVVNGFVICYL